MKRFGLLLLLFLLIGCPEPTKPPVAKPVVGVGTVSSQTVVVLDIITGHGTRPGLLTQQTLVAWLEDNPEARVVQMEVVGTNGHPNEIVLLVEGKVTK